MLFDTISTSFVTVLAAFATTTSAAPAPEAQPLAATPANEPHRLQARDWGDCQVNQNPISQYSYYVTINNDQDTNGLCGGLWDNLKRFSNCVAPTFTSCTRVNGNTRWEFMVGLGCNFGMVESTIWEATWPHMGGVSCHW